MPSDTSDTLDVTLTVDVDSEPGEIDVDGEVDGKLGLGVGQTLSGFSSDTIRVFWAPENTADLLSDARTVSQLARNQANFNFPNGIPSRVNNVVPDSVVRPGPPGDPNRVFSGKLWSGIFGARVYGRTPLTWSDTFEFEPVRVPSPQAGEVADRVPPLRVEVRAEPTEAVQDLLATSDFGDVPQVTIEIPPEAFIEEVSLSEFAPDFSLGSVSLPSSIDPTNPPADLTVPVTNNGDYAYDVDVSTPASSQVVSVGPGETARPSLSLPDLSRQGGSFPVEVSLPGGQTLDTTTVNFDLAEPSPGPGPSPPGPPGPTPPPSVGNADFQVTDISIVGSDFNPGGLASADVTAVNRGEAGAETIDVAVPNGTKSVSFNGGRGSRSTKTIDFTLPTDPGQSPWTVTADGVSATGEFPPPPGETPDPPNGEVPRVPTPRQPNLGDPMAPPEGEWSGSLNVTPSPVTAGESFTVEASVSLDSFRSSDQNSVTDEFHVRLDGQNICLWGGDSPIESALCGPLPSGITSPGNGDSWSRQFSGSQSMSLAPGQHTLELVQNPTSGGRSPTVASTTFTVEAGQPDIRITNVRPTAPSITPGASLPVDVTAENRGGPGSATFPVRIGQSQVDRVTFDLDSGEAATKSLSLNPGITRPTTSTVSVGNADPANFEVAPEGPNISLTDLSVPVDSVTPGQTGVPIEATAENTGGPGSQSFPISIQTVDVGTFNFEIPAGETETRRANVQVPRTLGPNPNVEAGGLSTSLPLTEEPEPPEEPDPPEEPEPPEDPESPGGSGPTPPDGIASDSFEFGNSSFASRIILTLVGVQPSRGGDVTVEYAVTNVPTKGSGFFHDPVIAIRAGGDTLKTLEKRGEKGGTVRFSDTINVGDSDNPTIEVAIIGEFADGERLEINPGDEATVSTSVSIPQPPQSGPFGFPGRPILNSCGVESRNIQPGGAATYSADVTYRGVIEDEDEVVDSMTVEWRIEDTPVARVEAGQGVPALREGISSIWSVGPNGQQGEALISSHEDLIAEFGTGQKTLSVFINDTKLGDCTPINVASPPPAFAPGQTDFPQRAPPGGEVSPSLVVQNVGNGPGRYQVLRQVNGNRQPVGSGSIPPGEGAEVTDTVQMPQRGELVLQYIIVNQVSGQETPIDARVQPTRGQTEITNVNAPGTVPVGESFDVNVTLMNSGGSPQTADVALRDSTKSREVAPGDESQVTFTTSLQRAGDQLLQISAVNANTGEPLDSAEVNVTGATADVSIRSVDYPENAPSGNEYQGSVIVSNGGAAPAQVEVAAADSTDSFTIQPNSEETFTHTKVKEPGGPDTFTVTVTDQRTGNQVASRNIRVGLAQSRLSIQRISYPQSAPPGENVTGTITLRNSGNAPGEVTVDIEDFVRTVTVPANGTEQVTHRFTKTEEPAQAETIDVRNADTGDTIDTRRVTINTPLAGGLPGGPPTEPPTEIDRPPGQQPIIVQPPAPQPQPQPQPSPQPPDDEEGGFDLLEIIDVLFPFADLDDDGQRIG